MALSPRATSARCLGLVGTAFIAPDGGRANIAAKTAATLWYLLVLPDAQTRLHRQLHRKRVPWYAPSRLLGIAVAATNIVTMPLSWALLVAGKKNASRIAALGVLVNPPSLTLSTLLVTEITTALVKKIFGIASDVGAFVAKPFQRKEEAPPTTPAPSASETLPPPAE